MGIETKNTNEQGHFFHEKQKEIKQKIMEDMLNGLFKNIHDNREYFNFQSVLDLTFSILIMLNRDVLLHTIRTFHLEHQRKQLMKDLFEQIRDQVNNIIKKGMM